MQRTVQGKSLVRLSKIFTSIEGEGILFGTKTMFVRLAGCPLKCHWCDTPYAVPMESGEEYSVAQAKDLIAKNLEPNTYKVNFTGGEPLAQHEAVGELARFAREKGIRTYLESACYDSSRFARVVSDFDICKIEFKLSDSDAVEKKAYQNLVKNELECLRLSVENRKITYVKIVVTDSSDIGEFRELVRRIFSTTSAGDLAGFIIQPSDKIDEPSLEKLFGFYDTVYPYYSEVRVVPQMHKAIGVR